jgi:ribose transport system permease protein
MSEETQAREAAGTVSPGPGPAVTLPPGGQRGGGFSALSLAEPLALPVMFVIMVIIYSLIEPSTFPTTGNVAAILGPNTVLFIIMIGALVPLLVGDFDLSVASISGFSGMMIALLETRANMSVVLACVIAVAASVLIGVVNAFFTVYFGSNSFIVTLGTGTAVTGVVYAISGSQTISGVSTGLTNMIYGNALFGIPLEFYYGIVIALVAWYVLEMTPLGQRATFAGQSRSVSRLSGVRVDRVRAGAFIVAALLAGLSGIVAVGTSGSADPSSGPALMLPALAAVFLGETTIRPGRLNVWGATIAAYFLATGVQGLELRGLQSWVEDAFYGGALVVAVTASQVLRRNTRRR